MEWKTVDTALAALIGLAIVAVIVGNGSTAASAIGAFFTMMTGLVSNVLNPATAAASTVPSLALPGGNPAIGTGTSPQGRGASLGGAMAESDFSNAEQKILAGQAFAGSAEPHTGDSGIQTVAHASRKAATKSKIAGKATHQVRNHKAEKTASKHRMKG
jgi:hypothetical protein